MVLAPTPEGGIVNEILFGRFSQAFYFLLGIISSALVIYLNDKRNRKNKRERFKREICREVNSNEFNELSEWIGRLNVDGSSKHDLEEFAEDVLQSTEHDYDLSDVDEERFKLTLTYMILRDASPAATDRLQQLEINDGFYHSNTGKVSLLSDNQAEALDDYYSTLKVVKTELQYFSEQFGTEGPVKPDASDITEMNNEQIQSNLSSIISRFNDIGSELDKLEAQKGTVTDSLDC